MKKHTEMNLKLFLTQYNLLNSLLFIRMKLACTCGLMLTFFNLFGNTDSQNLPDSIPSLLDKTATIFALDEAKQLYDEGKIKVAISKLHVILIKNESSWKANYWLAQSYYKVNHFSKALFYSEKALAYCESPDGELYELFARANHQAGNITEALSAYNKAITLLSTSKQADFRIADRMAQCNFALSEMELKREKARKFTRGEVNSDLNEYGGLLTNNGKTLFFVGRKENTTGGLKNPDDEQYFEDVYTAVFDEKNGMWDSISNELGHLNGIGFDALSYINSIGTKGLLTMNTTATDMEEITESSDIFEVTKKEGSWQKPKLINNNTINTSYFDGAATLSDDGNTMVFVSDRTGEKTSTDLYIVKKNGKKWGEATLMPAQINTLYRETTPSLSPDGKTLFFSSDGHIGMGGYDVFVSYFKNNEWTSPLNLGSAVNSVNDDTHFQYYPSLKKGIMSSVTYDEQQSNYNMYDVNISKLSITLPIGE